MWLMLDKTEFMILIVKILIIFEQICNPEYHGNALELAKMLMQKNLDFPKSSRAFRNQNDINFFLYDRLL